MSKATEADRRAVRDIEKDLTDRRGLRQEWERIDDEIQDEIRNVWRDLVAKAMKPERDSAAKLADALRKITSSTDIITEFSQYSMGDVYCEAMDLVREIAADALAEYERGRS